MRDRDTTRVESLSDIPIYNHHCCPGYRDTLDDYETVGECGICGKGLSNAAVVNGESACPECQDTHMAACFTENREAGE